MTNINKKYKVTLNKNIIKDGEKMKTVHFRDINDDNRSDVMRISLNENQLDFIESVADCLKEAEETKEWHPLAIYVNECVVGFAMYGSFDNNKYTWIDRIMIDKKHQMQGIGKAAMLKLIDVVSSEYKVDTLYLSIIEKNYIARKLYEGIGFRYINEKDENGELIFEYKV